MNSIVRNLLVNDRFSRLVNQVLIRRGSWGKKSPNLKENCEFILDQTKAGVARHGFSDPILIFFLLNGSDWICNKNV